MKIRSSMLIFGSVAGIFLVGFQAHDPAPVGTWTLVKGTWLQKNHDFQQCFTMVKDGKVTNIFKTYKVAIGKTVTFTNGGLYTETRSPIYDQVNWPNAAPAPVKYAPYWENVPFKMVRGDVLVVERDPREHGGGARTIQFQVKGDLLTLTEGKDVEVFSKTGP